MNASMGWMGGRVKSGSGACLCARQMPVACTAVAVAAGPGQKVVDLDAHPSVLKCYHHPAACSRQHFTCPRSLQMLLTARPHLSCRLPCASFLP